jgi:hypothetical protein
MRRLILASFALVLLSPACARAQQLISVFVTSDNNGFSGPGASDSALDLQKSLRNKKSLRVVDTAQEADVIVRVDSRDQRKEINGYTTNTNRSDDGKSSTKTTTANDTVIRTVHATLLAGDYTQALDADSSVGWRFAADGIAGQVDRWVSSNYARLISRRSEGGNAAPPPPPPQGAAPLGPSGDNSAPPTPPAAPSDTSIEPGMTTAQVTKALGEPEKKVNFGQKSLWTYKGMQVVFENGKVTDVKF